MTALEIVTLTLAALGGIGVPLSLSRTRRQLDLEISVAKLQTESSMWSALHADLRGMREDVREMSAAIARLEGALNDRLHHND